MEYKISVLIICYNYGQYLPQAIESVINQTYPASEIIVVDDGSSDNTSEVAKKYSHVKYYYHDNQGLTKTLNRGIDLATNNYLCFLDADDYYSAEKLEKQIQVFKENKEILIVNSKGQNFIDEACSSQEKANLEKYLAKDGSTFCSALISKRVFEMIGKMDESFKIAAALEWMQRSKLLNIPQSSTDDILLFRRIHSNNISAKNILAREYSLIARKAFQFLKNKSRIYKINSPE